MDIEIEFERECYKCSMVRRELRRLREYGSCSYIAW